MAGEAASARAAAVPDRSTWPEPDPESAGGRELTRLILATFRLNDRLMAAAQRLAAAGDITAAWWQVLGGVLDEPRTFPDIGRRMGMTRQGVRRIAGILLQEGLAELRPHPTDRRTQLLACTEAGYWAIRRISVEQHPWAAGVADSVPLEELRAATATMDRLVTILDDDARD
jgi:DNA-binding MarR family transcriptional regulator